MSRSASQDPQSGADKKLRELILHISLQSEGDCAYEALKLARLLFFADFLAYLRLGESITGAEYERAAFGPAPRGVAAILEDMERRGEIATRWCESSGLSVQRPLALRNPHLGGFSAEEIALADELTRRYWAMSATRMSEAFHEFAGWQWAEPGEVIPYEVALVGSREPTQEERAKGKELERLLSDRSRPG